MTARSESRQDQVQRIRQLLQEQEDLRARRDRAAFQEALAALLDRVELRPPPPPDPPAATTRSDPRAGAEWWSPRPVLGYRLWEMREGRLHGAWTPWPTHRKTAVCLDKQSRATGPVPHDAAECRRPPCGIYALASPGRLRRAAEHAIVNRAVPTTLAIGLVAMWGRVVEHEHGYRAEHAEVVALALITAAAGKPAVLVTLREPQDVAAAFAAPRQVRSTRSPEVHPVHDAVSRALLHLRGCAAGHDAA